MLTAKLDATGYLLTAVLLVFMATACLGLWWSARAFRAFRSVSLYLLTVASIFFIICLHKPDPWHRTRAISAQSAKEIARAAQQYGQQEDITVLTLQFAPSEVLHA